MTQGESAHVLSDQATHQNRHRSYRFKGGITLPVQTDAALDLPILVMPQPQLLTFDLRVAKGNYLRAVVKEGDTVQCAQTLALAGNDMGVPLLASASGIVTSVDDFITVRTRPEHSNAAAVTVRGDRTANLSWVNKLQALGLKGLGGGAFSSQRKISSALHLDGSQALDTLIINAAECEPLICCDQALIRETATEVVESISLLAAHLGVTRCLIGIEDSMPQEIALLQQALQTIAVHNIQLQSIPTIYPTGSERLLIRVLTGRELAPQQLPRDQGVLCFNIATAIAIKRALRDNLPLTDRVVTVTGSGVRQPRNVRVPFGTRLIDLARFVCPEISPERLALDYRITLGGPMSGIQIPLQTTSVSAASNCFMLDLLSERKTVRKPAMPCIRCGDCDKVCPAELLPQQLHWYCRDGNLHNAQKFNLSSCIECGCCDYVCPSHIALTAQFRQARFDLQEQQRETQLAAHAQQRFEARERRLQLKDVARQHKIQQRKDSIAKNADTGTAASAAIQATLARAKQRRKQKGTPPPADADT